MFIKTRQGLCYASAFNSPLTFTAPQSRTPISTLPLIVYFSPNTTMAVMGSSFQAFYKNSNLYDDFLEIVIELRSLSIVAEFASPETSIEKSTPASQVLEIRYAEVERSLAILNTYGMPDEDARTINSCKIAAMIYTSIVLRYNPASSTPISWLEDLKSILVQTNILRVSKEFGELYAWITFMGCVALIKLEGELRDWFVERFAEMVRMLELGNEDKLKERLARFLWVDARSSQYHELWNMIRRFV
jgi:hypothetical protein